MLIQTLKRRLAITQKLKSSMDMDIVVAKDLWEERERSYLLVSLKNPDLINKSVPFFVEQMEKRTFRDFVECFSKESQFYMMFVHHNKPLLSEKFAEELYSLTERLEIGKSLLSHMVLMDMAPSIQSEVLKEHNLLLGDSLQVFFNYIIEDVSDYPNITIAKVQKELGRIFREIFRPEIATQVVEEVRVFTADLEQGRFKNYLDIYQAYDSLYVLLQGLQEVGEILPKSFLFRCWERIKKLSGYAMPVMAGVILTTALIFLIYTVFNPGGKPGNSPIAIETIGTVKAE